MEFSGNWVLLTSTRPNVLNGLLVTSGENNSLIIKNLSSSVQKEFSKSELVGNYKYRSEILHILQKSLEIFEVENKFVDESAAQIIDEICEANRLLY